ncbi:BglG family transcription antiterminator [Sebaldella sp. S0638]|uniref:BglG family transcription antiterminator n=1 Tax=Sebaldella sp. S0638 TaxID=2957809 RepID=UPI00209E730C|nr:PTS sugar transporter subunit IIA [Sebaldella sp. S0638]MCP1224399.1 PTS sugar transporter subunit IIA [Sebaldella sp. S0638]
MSLKQRHIEILNLVFQNDKVMDIKYISEHFQVSERSIRYDIKEINEEFINSENTNILEMEEGKLVSNISREELTSLIKDMLPQKYIFTSEERIEILLLEILLFREKFTLQALSDELLISKATLRKDIKDMNEKIKEFGVKIDINNNQGYILTGEESNIRQLMISILHKYGGFTEEIEREDINNLKIVKLLIFEKKKKYFQNEDINLYKNILLKIQQKTKKIITDEAYDALLLHMIITSIRNRGKYFITEDISNSNFIKSTEEYKIIKEIFQNEDVNYREKDQIIFTDFYMGSYSYNTKFSFYLNWMKIETLVGRILEDAAKVFDTDFKNDQILIKELINHMKPAIYRIKNKMSLKVSILEDVKTEYADLYEKTRISLGVINEFLDESIDEDEIAFITIMFKRAITRNQEKLLGEEKRNILLVCGLGYSSSQFLAENINEKFDVNIVDIIPFNQLENFEYIKSVDLVVSTIDIEMEGLEVVKVNPILQQEDIDKLEEYALTKKSAKIPISKILKVIKENKHIENEELIIENIKKQLREYVKNDIETEKTSNFLELLDKRNTALNVDLKNWEEVLEYSGKLLIDSGYIVSDYIEEMKEQIRNFGDYVVMGENTILPHGKLNESVKKTGFSFVSLKNPISFFGSEIKIAICLASVAKHEHINAILELNNYFRDPEFEKELLKINTREQLENFLINRRNR